MANRRIMAVAVITLVLIAGCGTKKESATDTPTTTADPVTTTTDPLPADKAAIKQYYRDMRQATLKGERSALDFDLPHSWPVGAWTLDSLTCKVRELAAQRLGRKLTADEYIQAVDQSGPPDETTIEADSIDTDPGFTSVPDGPGAGQPIPGRVYVVKETHTSATTSPVTAEVHVSILPDGTVVAFPQACT